MALNGKRTKRKRRRPEVSDKDEEIDSDEAELDSGEEGGVVRQEGSPVEEDAEELDETVAEKRLRLAKKYLSDLGVDEEDSEDAEELEDVTRRDIGLTIRNIADGIASSKLTVSVRHKAHRLSPCCIDLTPNADFAVSGGKDRRVNLWDVETCKTVTTFEGGDTHLQAKDSKGHVKSVLAVAVTDDGKLVASGGEDHLVRIWDVRKKGAVHSFPGHRKSITSLCFRHGSKQLVSASNDRTLKMFDLDEMAYVETLFGHGAEVISVDALSRERYLSGGMDGSLRLWKIAESSQVVFKSPAQSIDAVACIEDSLFFTGASDGSLSLWGINRKKPLHTHFIEDSSPNKSITSVSACSHSDMCASGLQNGRLSIWKAGGGKAQRTLDEVLNMDLGGSVNSIKFGRSGKVLAVATGQEHRLGRWSKAPSWKSNAIRFLSFAES
mmetsp:Transcript_4285/g.18281  ORF Transcript_4285/g.18281 Transcript_4285/m.18281 type:complete len:438 (-) Transcript_4285:1205-2518(-)